MIKLIADARLKLEEDLALALPCIVREDSRGKPLTCAALTDGNTGQSGSEKKNMRNSKAKTYGPHCRKEICGKFSLWPGTQASFCSRRFENTRSRCG